VQRADPCERVDGELIATASGTFKIRKRAPAPEVQASVSPGSPPQA
jgi:hypothetical protein